jgi:hypothetical protein
VSSDSLVWCNVLILVWTDEVTDKELKEDYTSDNKPAQKQKQNKAVVSDQSNKLKEKLKGEGLDPEFWSNKLKTKLDDS